MNPKKVNKQSDSSNTDDMKVESAFNKTGFFPRSIGRTFKKIIADFAPRAEGQFVQKFQISKKRTRTAVRFLAMLVIVPLLTQQLSNQFLLQPIIEHIRSDNISQVFLNYEMEEEALHELKIYEQRLKFENFIHSAPLFSSEEIATKVQEKAIEISQEFRDRSNKAISNVFADMIALVAFGLFVTKSTRELEIFKSFIDDIIYGLSDSAKAFLIILFTDMFVGFHSPHGWEVILEELAEHFGLPPNENVISLFIATFPVILDTIIKYWIFRYVSRLSPSALATFKEMND
jgi:hypothetical protein